VRRRGQHTGNDLSWSFTESYKKRSLLYAAPFASPSSGWNLSSVTAVVKADTFCKLCRFLQTVFVGTCICGTRSKNQKNPMLEHLPRVRPKLITVPPLDPCGVCQPGFHELTVANRVAQNLMPKAPVRL
jgi:hypothetical protein